MERLKYLIFRYLTHADFYNIYKPQGSEVGGGGQGYIDVQTTAVPVARWGVFFENVPNLRIEDVANGPKWVFSLNSIGKPDVVQRDFYLYQRRPNSVCIPCQHLGTRDANRVVAWHADNGFPEPINPADRQQCPSGLFVFLARTHSDRIWAGWGENPGTVGAWGREECQSLAEMLLNTRQPGDAGFLELTPHSIFLETNNPGNPFHCDTISPYTVQQDVSDSLLLDRLFQEDELSSGAEPQYRQSDVRIRNTRSVAALKQLYRGECQISGTQYSFMKNDGEPYIEAHHLIPLGEGGADRPENLIVVCPMLHRMLHYANVKGIDLNRIVRHDNGSAALSIHINDEEYTITWRPEHASRIKQLPLG